MPLTSDDIVMAYTLDHVTSVAVCKVCGYSDKVYFDPWEHTLTDCLKRLRDGGYDDSPFV